MISLQVVIALLALHLIADFFLQSDWMAINKSKLWAALYLHAIVYSFCFIGFGFAFFVITFFAHFVTDAITSRITSKLWFLDMEPMVVPVGPFKFYARVLEGRRHWFFVVIGIDQFIHYVTLLLTYQLLR